MRAGSSPGDGFRLWWLGQSGFLVAWRGRHLVMDPYLSDSLTRKYATTDKPHVRMTARVVDPARLDFVDVVTASHEHTDHLDPDTLGPLMSGSPRAALIAPESCLDLARERSGADPERLLGLDDGTRTGAGGFAFTGVAAAHEQIEQDGGGRSRWLGVLVGFGPWTLYHAGDTVSYLGLAERVRALAGPGGVDLALLPINGRAPERRVAGNLDGREAAALARAIGARLAVPCHYEMFEFNTAPPDSFVAEAARLGQPVAVLRNGGRLDWPPSDPVRPA